MSRKRKKTPATVDGHPVVAEVVERMEEERDAAAAAEHQSSSSSSSSSSEGGGRGPGRPRKKVYQWGKGTLKGGVDELATLPFKLHQLICAEVKQIPVVPVGHPAELVELARDAFKQWVGDLDISMPELHPATVYFLAVVGAVAFAQYQPKPKPEQPKGNGVPHGAPTQPPPRPQSAEGDASAPGSRATAA